MLQIEFFNRLNPENGEHHIDDTFLKVGPFDLFQWTYSHLRLLVMGKGEFDVTRYDKEAVVYDGIMFGDFRIVPYDANDKEVKPLTKEAVDKPFEPIRAIFDAKERTLTFLFEGVERVVQVEDYIEEDHWGSFEVCGEFFDYNLWMDEFKDGELSFRLGIYELKETDGAYLAIGDCIETYPVEVINHEGPVENILK